jgi:AcrR family transcriptional regulator
MSRVDVAARMVDCAVALGTRSGVSALTLQGVATESGVSKALVLYHHKDKEALLLAVAERLVEKDVDALRTATRAPDVLEGWRHVAGDATRRAERALLATLLHEAPLQAAAPAMLAARAHAAEQLALAVLALAGLRARVAHSLLGRFVVHHLDGMAVGTREQSVTALDAELDATALALMGLGTA